MSWLTKKPTRPAAALAFALTAASCGREGPGETGLTDAVTLRDSAGITIVENHDSAWTADTRWSIEAEPDLVIGSVDGSVPGTDFGRVGDVLTAGRSIAVEAAALREVRFFDAESGAHLRTVGGRGGGPMEFGNIGAMGRIRGDSVAAFDGTARKVVVFPSDSEGGRVTRTVGRLWDDGRGWAVSGWRAEDGSWAMTEIPDPLADSLPPGRHILVARTHLFSADGEPLASMGQFPDEFTFRGEQRIGRRISFAPTGMTRLRGNRLYRGFPIRSFEVRVLEMDSGAQRLIRVQRSMTPAPDGLRQAMVDVQYQSARDQGVSEAQLDLFRGQIESEQVVDTLPGYRDFLVSSEGHIWFEDTRLMGDLPVQDYPFPSRWPEPIWTVVDPDGRWLGTIRVPEGFDLKEIGADYILGVRRNELDVPFIERYRILKPQ